MLMDIEINAYGKQIKISGIDCDDADDCIETAYELWDRLDRPESVPVTNANDKVERPTLEASGGGHAEKSYQPMGFAYLNDGERLNVK